MPTSDRLLALVAPIVSSAGVELVDLEYGGGSLRVVVDEPGGIGTERLGAVTVAISRALDAADPLPGRYTLEVSSPGVERPLRTPEHFRRAVGQRVTLRDTGAEGSPSRRIVGVVVAADDEAVTVRADPERPTEEPSDVRLHYDRIDRARSVFEWGPAPKPGKGSKPGAAKRRPSGAPTTRATRGATT
ncbi:MAG: ribosome maturation factor RimP [Actinobacteria bacterium]|nr:ribosome maturation factor RimP [Actinomycetota bacterium]